MAGVRFAELQSRPIEFLDFTSLTLDEFQHKLRQRLVYVYASLRVVYLMAADNSIGLKTR